MLPQPPDLADVVGEWNNAQLFRIVKHGVRFTGMPAWPMQDRDDEVWAMVAFLRELS
jgi:mono/diheme cytochrome c family protein